jgi:hypothetical protein
MTLILRSSAWLYSILLVLYPHDLRARFGPDMLELFENQLNDALKTRGTVGIVRPWFTAVGELLDVAVPARLTSTGAIAGALSFLVSSGIAWVFFRAVG